MKKKFLVATVISISLLLLLSQHVSMTRARSQAKLELRLSSPRSIIKVGEVAFFNVEAVNIGEQKLSFSDTFNEGSGYLHVLVSQDGKSFRQYDHSAWGLDDTFRKNIDLEPGEKIIRTLSLLWNKRPNSPSSIADDVIKRASEGKILTDYAFPEPGDYYVKVAYSVNLTTHEKPVLLESKPIKMTIEEPIGENLVVWNKIKDNGDFAYFIQEGNIRIPSYKSEEREKFLQEVNQILVDHPSSFYTLSLRQSLEKFRASEARIQEIRNKQKPH